MQDRLYHKILLFFVCLCLLGDPAYSLSFDELETGQIDIRYVDRGQGQLKEVKAVALIKAPPDKVWQAITDYGNYQEFMPRVLKSRLIKRTGNRVDAYALLNLPWPFQNTWYINRYVEDINHYVVRWSMVKGSIKDNSGSWQLHAYGQGYTLTRYMLLVDPGITILPQWVVDTGTKVTVPSILNAVRDKASRL